MLSAAPASTSTSHPRARPFFFSVAALVAALAGGCGGEETLSTELDASANVVEESPVDFAPTEGGFGQGVYEDSNPFTFLVLSQDAIENAGEGNCGQFSAGEGDLELTLGGVLGPGQWTLSPETEGYAEGEANLSFANGAWSGAVEIGAASEEHGASVSGSIDALNADGERFKMSFEALFHGCGVD